MERNCDIIFTFDACLAYIRLVESFKSSGIFSAVVIVSGEIIAAFSVNAVNGTDTLMRYLCKVKENTTMIVLTVFIIKNKACLIASIKTNSYWRLHASHF